MSSSPSSSSPSSLPTQLLGRALTVPFGAVAAARGARAVHPQGFLCRGVWAIERTHPLAGTVAPLQAGARYDVLARLSRGLGLPQGIGEFFGVAVRLLGGAGEGRHQDLLFNTSAHVPVLHHLPLPAPRWYAHTYSTCLPYRTDAGSLLIGLLPPPAPGPGPAVADMRDAIAEGTAFGVAIAGPRSRSRWERVGDLRLHEPLDPDEGDIDFDPFHTREGLTPGPAWLQTVRSEAYRWSRRGRHAPEEPRMAVRPDPPAG